MYASSSAASFFLLSAALAAAFTITWRELLSYLFLFSLFF
jgi:hypothetical protein